MKQWKFKVGDSVRITNYNGKTENIECSNIQAMIGNVYVIDEIGGYYRINSELFKENELELADSTVDQPVVEKILIVNKVRPEYTTYIENTKDVVMKFFVGTRLFDFYIIKNGEMIELNSDKDVFALYETPVNNIKEVKYADEKQISIPTHVPEPKLIGDWLRYEQLQPGKRYLVGGGNPVWIGAEVMAYNTWDISAQCNKLKVMTYKKSPNGVPVLSACFGEHNYNVRYKEICD